VRPPRWAGAPAKITAGGLRAARQFVFGNLLKLLAERPMTPVDG